MKRYDLSRIMKRAWALVKEVGMTISSALRRSWKEAKMMASEIKNVVIEHFESYNARRYSIPWVCKMTADGRYDFSERIGCYTAEHGEDGDLVIFQPVAGQMYGYGQKDYRGNNTIKKIVKWTGSAFAECNKFGKEK